jgi:hypothetical protein
MKHKYEIDKLKKIGLVTKYCSKNCLLRANAIAQRTKFCPCGKPAGSSNRKYCSVDCRKKYLNLRRLPDIKCRLCGIEFRPNSHLRKFCSMECKNKYHSIRIMRKNNPNYKDGSQYRVEFFKMRSEIFMRDGFHCQICGIEEKQTKDRSNLLIHHLDLNKHNDLAINLITLCMKCHQNIHKLKKLENVRSREMFMTYKQSQTTTSLQTEF